MPASRFSVWLAAILLLASSITHAAARPRPILVRSPNGRLTASVTVNDAGQVMFSLARGRILLIEPSQIGIVLKGEDATVAWEMGLPERRILRETYATRGAHARATNYCQVAEVPLKHCGGAGLRYTLEVRVFDDGAAYRYIVPGEGTRTVSGEFSSWTLPTGSQVWYAERDSDWKLKTYAGDWRRAGIEQMPKISKQGPVQCAPLVIETPGKDFLVLTEAAVFNYSGMRLRATGNRRFQADFTEGTNGFQLSGTILSPWRVTIAASDLNRLVNNDVLTSLCPGPDPRLFPNTDWVKPGRAAWRWWSRGTGSLAEERAVVDAAEKLGFEYTIVDEGWELWPSAWDSIRALCAYGKDKGVGVFLWKHYNDVRSSEKNWAQLAEFADKAAHAGVAGLKLDFLNSESLDRVQFEEAALRLAAERKLLVNFHGCRKPGGESRTYPNELTREAVRGLELNKMKEGPITPRHNAALPFTRFAVGHADYTPVGFSNPGPTTFAHQMAAMVLFTSPLQVIAEDPEQLLQRNDFRPALSFLKHIPSTWDETRVLRQSTIGELAIMARRAGNCWCLAALNGGTGARSIESVDLSFLGRAEYRAMYLSSSGPTGFASRSQASVNRTSKLQIDLLGGDGFVGLFTPLP